MAGKTCQVDGCHRPAYCRQKETGLHVCFACYAYFRRRGTYDREIQRSAQEMPNGQACQVDGCDRPATRKHRKTGLYVCDACAGAYTRNGQFERLYRHAVQPILDDLLSYFVEYKCAHDGLSPGIRDVERAFGLSSTSVAHSALAALVDRGDLIPIRRRRRVVGYRVPGYTWGKSATKKEGA